MPHYYFHLYNGVDAKDDQGLELADVEAARREATRAARSLAAAGIIEAGRLRLSDRIEVVNGDVVVATVKFSDVIAIES